MLRTAADWASTHLATPTGHVGIVAAHEGAPPLSGAGGLDDRAAREERQNLLLRPGATRADGAGRRARAEAPDALRTCFERDRDRILHASAFRRLAGKTQVFIFPADHQRTRLTHALEVAQVAGAIARATGLNSALTEAIALGHDCGHGPGGHASEEALGTYLPGGFDHAVWGADVVLAPLNLCAETLDGVRNHSWSRPAPSTPEGEVVAWADRIAYVCHDFEDAVSAGVVTPGDLPDLVRQRCGTEHSSQLGTFIAGVVSTIVDQGVVGMDAERAEALSEFRRCNYELIYMRPESMAQRDAVIDLLRALVDHELEQPSTPDVSDVSDVSEDDRRQGVVDWVAGMTDSYACRVAVDRLGWQRDRLPVGVREPGL